MTRPTKLQRHLDLIAYLVGRRLPVPVEELMERIPAYAEKWGEASETSRATARRTFERDKDELRDFGIPIRTVKYSINYGNEEVEGYIINQRDFYLPYLKLVSGEPGSAGYQPRSRFGTVEINDADAPLALAALQRVSDVPDFPLRSEARSAFRKLAFDLDPAAFSAESPVVFADRAQSEEMSANLRALSDALLARKRVGFRYRGIYRGEETEREVHGYGLLFQSGQWYLVGHDNTRSDVRVFRVSRMDDVVPNKTSPNTADYSVPDDFDLDGYVGREPWELGDQDEPPVTARVRFRFPSSLWAERNAHGELEQSYPDGSATRVFAVHQVNPFLRWVLSLQTEAEILEPAELIAELKEMAQRVVRAHEEPHGDE